MKKTETIQDNKELFTSGEWIIEERNGQICIEAINNDGEETTAAEVCVLHGNEKIDRKDAALIAQAPAMYKALKDAYELLNAGQPLGNDDLDNIYSILNKANSKQ